MSPEGNLRELLAIQGIGSKHFSRKGDKNCPGREAKGE
jgi:hypothetical protein